MTHELRELHTTLDGRDTAPPLILGPSLGTSLAVWEPQLPALTRTYRTLRWDLPGHGDSPTGLLPDDGSASIADLATLVLHSADAHGWDRFAYAGISLGGAVGLYLAAHHPDRIASLTVVCSSAHFAEPSVWRERAKLVREEGTEAMVATRPGLWFSQAFAETPRGRALLDDLRRTDRAGYAACCDVLADYDVRDALPSITAPTLVVAGRDDPATPPPHAREIADAIQGASLVEVAHAAHLAGVECPEAVTSALVTHITTRATDDASRHAAGMAVRRAVLGDAHVDRAVARTTPFTARFQDFITRYAWGEIWTGDGLDRRMRSAITLTALIAHGHDAELAMHVRSALTNGLSREEIGEVLLQSAIYCGVPAANSAFATAQRVFDEIDEIDNKKSSGS
ncbi:4-carboxymuconolactone decarboxylase [Streptomyces sp. NPDC021098]|uniref:bifunctional 3-oxoadipate enol-lactonase/4-carboxymuconolactone decarboxylase PcaDC n=1 Tax=unclassified Streptomyces TaxID=2593676 RepID=UPI0037AA58A8